MNKNKKVLTVFLAVATMGLAAGVSLANKSISFRSFSENCTHDHVEHYKVYPTTTDGGRIEHWACCDCGTAWYDEAKTRVVANRSALDIAPSSEAVEIPASSVDSDDLISTIYGEGDKTKGLDQTNWGADGTTAKSIGNWKFYNVDGINCLKASAVNLTDAQRTLQHNINNGGFGEFRFHSPFAQAKYVTFSYKYYDLNTETTYLSDSNPNAHFISQQYGDNYYNSDAIELINDNAWHKAVVSFPVAKDINYLTMKFFHFDGEFYISNLVIHQEQPKAVKDYDFSRTAQILDFSATSNLEYSIANDGAKNYLKVTKKDSGGKFLALNYDFKAGQTASIVMSYVTSDASTGSGQFVVLVGPGNGLNKAGDQYVMGNAPWDGGWNGSKIKLDIDFTANCTSALIELSFNNDANAYYRIDEIVVKDYGMYVDFTDANDMLGFINPQNVNTQATTNSLKLTKAAGGTNSISLLKSIPANAKVFVKLAYVTSNRTFVNGSNQFTFLAYVPNNGFNGNNGDPLAVMGNAPWDGGWNGNEIVVELQPTTAIRGLFLQFVFNGDSSAYFEVTGITFGARTAGEVTNPGDATFFCNEDATTASYSAQNHEMQIRRTGDNDFRSITYYNKFTAGQTVSIKISYVTSNASTDNGQFTVVAYKANKNSEYISGACEVKGNAPWDGGWDGTEVTISLDIDEDCYGVFLKLTFNNDADAYFAVSSLKAL